MNICVVRSDNKTYLCNSDFEHKKGDKVMWKCGKENGWGEVTVDTFKMCPYDVGGFERAGHPIGEILGKFTPTATYVRETGGAEPERPKGRFKVWCETRAERDEALAVLSMDGIGINKPFDPFFLKRVPIGLLVTDDKITLCLDREDFDMSDAPLKELDEDNIFFVNAEQKGE